MPVFRIGQQHAGQEGPQRHRQSDRIHHQRDADHQQQRKRGEHLAHVGARDKAQRRPNQVAAADHHRADHRHRLHAGHPASGARTGAAGSLDGKQGQQRDHRDGGNVLEQQDAEAGGAGRRAEQVALGQRRQRDRGGRQRQAQAGDQRHLPRRTRQCGRPADHQRAGGKLGATVAEDAPPQGP
ncbi:hypothetical protein D9M72_517010 [compost metagenome]